MRICVVGCTHGCMRAIYDAVAQISPPVDLVICCGDFQAVRNSYDLQCTAIPPKYRKMGDFIDYYTGKFKVPVPTIFVGGNHEASNHLFEMYYGGWVCENVFYLGHSGVVSFGGLRIAGCSGIYKPYDYRAGYQEVRPNNCRNAFHLREFEVMKLMQIKQPVDIFVSHDWPQGILEFGDFESLFRLKPFFRPERTTLGSQPLRLLLNTLQPKYWFSAHLHVRFTASCPHPGSSTARTTEFLALDKIGPKRDWLDVLDVEAPNDSRSIQYDPEWLAILHSSFLYLPIGGKMCPMHCLTIAKSTCDISKNNTVLTPPPFHPSNNQGSHKEELYNFLLSLFGPFPQVGSSTSTTQENVTNNPEEISLSDDCPPERNEVDSTKDDYIPLSAAKVPPLNKVSTASTPAHQDEPPDQSNWRTTLPTAPLPKRSRMVLPPPIHNDPPTTTRTQESNTLSSGHTSPEEPEAPALPLPQNEPGSSRLLSSIMFLPPPVHTTTKIQQHTQPDPPTTDTTNPTPIVTTSDSTATITTTTTSNNEVVTTSSPNNQ
ncbi:Lariat debranching enzyme, DBR1 [Pelomyxa schiedti]|nr:Lariat debranching enzyme, DBR1 [Pelomyxa schiedti]